MKNYPLCFTPVVTLVLLNANAAVAAEKVSETTPQNMTCREYLDMNPKVMTGSLLGNQ